MPSSRASVSLADRPFLTATWRYLVVLNYEMDPAHLTGLVPAGTVLDLWQGRALVSLVGFRFLDTRVLGWRLPGHTHFDEVNLRLYVRRDQPDGTVRRGVTFVREFVPRPAIALVARALYNEPYRAVRMRHVTPPELIERPGTLAYSWRTTAGWQQIAATTVGAPTIPSPQSEAAFITEHYWGYTAQRNGSTLEYAVTHPPWRVWETFAPSAAIDIRAAYGPAFVDALSGPPCSAMVAEGSPVVVYRPRTVVPS